MYHFPFPPTGPAFVLFFPRMVGGLFTFVWAAKELFFIFAHWKLESEHA